MSNTMTPKIISVTQESINALARGCPWNNPITVALKEQAFPKAREILIYGDEVYVDGMLVEPTLSMIRFIRDWNRGRKCVPMVLGYNILDNRNPA